MLWAFLWRWVLLTFAGAVLAAVGFILGAPPLLLLVSLVGIPPFAAYGMAREARGAEQRRLEAAIAEGVRRALREPQEFTPQAPP